MGVEPTTQKFFILIVNTIAIVLIWMMLNVLAGIYFELAFFDNWPSWKNILYYLAVIVSGIYLTKYLVKKWTPFL
ncbi:MAG: hypothetical protein ABIY51_12270 [Ferruginibacter sp.]